uniref:Uncharacterized protein n=1 Tax=Arion vulgaris TaxID=1028688 RepID=A0A0B7AAK2_9EUPU
MFLKAMDGDSSCIEDSARKMKKIYCTEIELLPNMSSSMGCCGSCMDILQDRLRKYSILRFGIFQT